MNRLSADKRRQILHLMVEGNTVNGIERLTGASKHTILRLLELAGQACMAHHDCAVRGVKAQRVECDEIWSFNYCKRANLPKAKAAPAQAGDVWTWTAIDADSKLLVSYLLGNRDADAAFNFMSDVADRLANRVQLTTDGHTAYLSAVLGAFAIDVDYAQLIKIYGPTADMAGPERKYSPGVCTGIRKRRVLGQPHKAFVSTSYVEKHNQTMRQHMKRYARLTAAHSKKIENLIHSMALYATWYNFARTNQAVRMSPAMAAGLETRLWDISDIVDLVEQWESPKLAA
jgi:IS1 family transposase